MSKEKAYFDSSDFITFTYQYRKAIGIIALTSILVSGIVSYLLPEKFKSTVVIYPSNTNSIAKALINSTAGNKSDIMEFGEEEKTEQMLEILNSEKVSQKIIAEFNLMEHYQIKKYNTSTPLTDLHEKYQRNISFQRNKNMAIEIEVLDENPKTAALIANRIIQVLDDVSNEIQKKRALQGFEIVKKAYADKLQEIKLMEDSLARIMKRGVLNVKSQSEVYTEAYVKAVAQGDGKASKTFEEKIAMLSNYGAQQISLKDNLENERLKLSDLREKFNEAKVDSEARIQNFFVVTEAFPAEIKSYPIRWLVILLSTIGAIFIGMISLTIFERLQKAKVTIENKL